MDNLHLLFVGLVALGHEDVVAGFGGCLLDAAQYAREEVVHHLGDDDADGIGSSGPQVHCLYVGLVVVLAGIGVYQVACFLADVRVVLQCPRHGRGRYVQCTCDVFDGDLRFVHKYRYFPSKGRQ